MNMMVRRNAYPSKPLTIIR